MTVLRAGRRKQLLGQIEMDAPLYSPPALIGDALYLATANGCTSSRQSFDPKRVKASTAAGEALLVATNDRSYRECAGLQPRWRGVAKKSKSTGSCQHRGAILSARIERMAQHEEVARNRKPILRDCHRLVQRRLWKVCWTEPSSTKLR